MENDGRKIPTLPAVSQAVITVALVIVVIVLSLWLVKSEAVRVVVTSLGYLGVFFVSVVSGFSIAVPVPTIAFLPLFVGSGLLFWPLLFVMTLGMTVGDAIGYLVGNAGRHIAEARLPVRSTQTRANALRDGRVYRFLESFHVRHRLWPFVVLAGYVSFVPAPNEVLVIPMAFMGYRLRYMFPIIFVGNFVFNTLAAFSIIGITQLL